MIYFVQPVDGGPIKIGTSENVDVRLKQLAVTYGKPLALLATMPGGREEELAIHERFAPLRFGRTEQFRPEPELLAFIGRPLFASASAVVEVMENHGPVTLLNLKGSVAERDALQQLSKLTGVPLSEAARRGLAMWAAHRGLKVLPPDWSGA